jgi:hypothetical protein
VTETASNQLIADVARDVAAQIAPQELPLFRAISEAYFKDPDRVLDQRAARDEPLGFGVGEAVSLVLPIVLAVASEVVLFLAAEVKKAVGAESGKLTIEATKKLFKRFRAADQGQPPVSPLTPEQLAHVRKLAFEKARLLKLPEPQAQLLAEAVVGSLAIKPS